MSKYSNKIYQAGIRFLNEKYKAIAIKIPSRNHVYNRIGYLRGPSTKALLITEIQPHNSTIAGRLFLQCSWRGNVDGEFQRFVMWSSDEVLAIFWMGSELFIDTTFRVTPHLFGQCLIVMSFDPPQIFLLLLLHAIIVQFKCVVFKKCGSRFLERALNSVKYQFPKSKRIGCYFSIRQAIFRKMKKDGIPDDEAQIELNMMCSLPSIEDDQINEKLQEIQNLKGLTNQN
ncbi:hypothetical protein HZS_6256 [Henneguya salminicola]|nr:hypothetical protein HZS_6256 [Henneguya salminicola]